MPKQIFLFSGLILFCTSFSSYSQEKFAWEFYGGPSQAFLPYELVPRNDFVSTSNELRYHFGTTFLWGMKNDWQLTAQLEFFKRELGTHGFSMAKDTLQITGYSTHGIPLLALGARKSWGNIFLQPSVSLMRSPSDLDRYGRNRMWNDIPLGVISKSDLGLGVRIEGGLKKYNRRGNFFLAGLRYQKGLILMDQMNAAVRYNERLEHLLSAKSRGSYFGMFLGYGINGHNLNSFGSRAPKRLYNDAKLLKHDLSLENGLYAMLYGGFRGRESPLSNDFVYSNLSGQFQAVLGYNFENFSIETGYGNFSYNANYQIDFDGIEALIMRWEHYSMPVIPLTFKYHIPLKDQNTVRFGPSFSAYFTLRDQSKYWFFSRGDGSVELDQKKYEYTSVVASDRELNHGRFVFNAGIFAEMSVFNSSFLTVKLSRNFASPDFVKINGSYLIEGTQVSVESFGNINGFMIDLGYKIPLKVLNQQLKRQRKATS
ncbi:hypothetical protein [Algoriphagus sp. AK58]|uniref:hypothetical protein n=1 Tax=Algoriphagus sp. AK58 TaxID=1406877 RepID=UPI001650839D|nr:hypothetical protein [Algoriphagus sp. AK58]MBC6366568.1 hypothetical protein [Algoriphagus sp. AK58]